MGKFYSQITFFREHFNSIKLLIAFTSSFASLVMSRVIAWIRICYLLTNQIRISRARCSAREKWWLRMILEGTKLWSRGDVALFFYWDENKNNRSGIDFMRRWNLSFYSTTSLIHTQFHDESTGKYFILDEIYHALISLRISYEFSRKLLLDCHI